MKDIKFVSDEIKARMDKSDADGGVFLKRLKAGDVLTVDTRNSTYILEVVDPEKWVVNIQGGIRFPESTEVTINGSTWGGSMLKIGFVGNGMCLEIRIPSEKHRLNTSCIENIHVKTDKFSYDVNPQELN
jgi:frataxin-like iron-binding protein CyaY